MSASLRQGHKNNHIIRNSNINSDDNNNSNNNTTNNNNDDNNDNNNTQSLTQSLTHSLTYSLHSLTHSLTHSPTHSLTHPPSHPLTHWFVAQVPPCPSSAHGALGSAGEYSLALNATKKAAKRATKTGGAAIHGTLHGV